LQAELDTGIGMGITGSHKGSQAGLADILFFAGGGLSLQARIRS
jgi:hypothetical protein